MRLAVVVPCYNEEEVLPRTLVALRQVLAELRAGGRIDEGRLWLIDDGSRDRTWDLIAAACTEHGDLAGIKLSRNVGHQNALLAGLLTAEGDAVVSIDADLQDDAAAIGAMVDACRDGADVVYAVRRRRAFDRFFKRFTAAGFYRVMGALGVDIVPDHADYRLLSRRALEELRGFREVNLFLRGIVPLLGLKSARVLYDRAPRAAGVSKYPLARMLAFAADGITSFSVVPLRTISLLGICLALGALLVAGWAAWTRLFTDHSVPGWASLLIPLSLIGGIQLLAIGAVGEYVGKIYQEVKDRPRYIIEKII